MEEKQKIFGVKRNVFFLGIVSFFNDFSSEMVQSVMPVFLTTVLGAPAAIIGAIEGVADAMASVLKVFSGWISDRTRRRKIFAVTGYSISVFARLLLSFVSNFWQVFFLRVVDRIGKGTRDAPRDALIAESSEEDNLGRSFGFHRSMDTFGSVLGPLFAFLLLPVLNWNYKILFFIGFVLGLFAIFSFVFIKEKKRSPQINNRENDPQNNKFSFKIFKQNKQFLFVVLAIFIFGLGGLPIGLLFLKTKEISVEATLYIPLLFFLCNTIFVLTSFPLGRLVDRIGEKTMIAVGFLFAAISYFILVRADSMFKIFIAAAILGIYFAATDGPQRVLAAKSLPLNMIATGQGFLNMAVGLSSLGAGVVGGLLWSLAGSTAAIVYAFSASFIGLILFLFVVKKKSPGTIEYFD